LRALALKAEIADRIRFGMGLAFPPMRRAGSLAGSATILRVKGKPPTIGVGDGYWGSGTAHQERKAQKASDEPR
jgi:hypothetical protein